MSIVAPRAPGRPARAPRSAPALLAILALAPLLLAAPAPAAVLLRYSATTGRERTDWTWKVERMPSGNVRVEQVSDRGETTRFENGPDGECIWYRTECPAKDLVFDCRRAGRRVEAHRIEKGRYAAVALELGAIPWYQDWDISLPAWVRSPAKTAEFWCLNDDLSAYTFWVEKLGKERFATAAGGFEAQRVRVRLTGFLSPFWSGDIYFRAADGLFLGDRMAKGQGAPDTVYELLSVSEGK